MYGMSSFKAKEFAKLSRAMLFIGNGVYVAYTNVLFE